MSPEVEELEVEEILGERNDGTEELVEDSDDDLSDLEVDEETQEIMHYVFGDDTDTDTDEL